MDKLANAFFSIFTPSMEALGNVMGPNNLGGKVVDLAQTIADWISGELLGLTNKAIAIFSEFEANGGITQMQEKIAEAGSLVSQIWEGAQTAVVATWDFFTQGGIQKAWNTFKENLELWTEQFKSVLSQWGHNALVYGGVIVRNIFWTMIDAFAIGAEFIFLKIKHAWQDWNPLGVVGDVAEIAWDTAFGAAEIVLGTAGGLLKTVGKGVQGEWHNPLTTVMEVGGRGLDRVSGWVEHGSIAGERNARQEEEMDAWRGSRDTFVKGLTFGFSEEDRNYLDANLRTQRIPTERESEILKQRALQRQWDDLITAVKDSPIAEDVKTLTSAISSVLTAIQETNEISKENNEIQRVLLQDG